MEIRTRCNADPKPGSSISLYNTVLHIVAPDPRKISKIYLFFLTFQDTVFILKKKIWNLNKFTIFLWQIIRDFYLPWIRISILQASGCSSYNADPCRSGSTSPLEIKVYPYCTDEILISDVKSHKNFSCEYLYVPKNVLLYLCMLILILF